MKCMYEQRRKKHRNLKKSDFYTFNAAVLAKVDSRIKRATIPPEKHTKLTTQEKVSKGELTLRGKNE